MKLALSLGGDAPKRLPDSIEKHRKMVANKNLEFCMGLRPVTNERRERENHGVEGKEEEEKEARVSSDPPLQLDLLPLSPFPQTQTSNNSLLARLPWITDNSATAEPGSSDNGPQKGEEQSSPNSAVSSFPMEFSSIYRARGGTRKRDLLERNEIVEEETERESSNDDDSNGLTRKKLRLSKQQSAFLEDSFKEHHSLNPKQKLALAKQLNLRPRQVEVWFQNRRARTKLKQTEVECEYLRRRCETLREENRRMQRELQELRALKTCQPFYMHPQQHLPATTLSMCPSCERVATTTVTSATTAGNPISTTVTGGSSLDAATSLCIANRPTFYPFSDASHNRPASPS